MTMESDTTTKQVACEVHRGPAHGALGERWPFATFDEALPFMRSMVNEEAEKRGLPVGVPMTAWDHEYGQVLREFASMFGGWEPGQPFEGEPRWFRIHLGMPAAADAVDLGMVLYAEDPS